jgi:hypothetical protein
MDLKGEFWWCAYNWKLASKKLGSCNIECLILNCEKSTLTNDFQKKKLSELQNVGCIFMACDKTSYKY